ncbi:MAG: Transcription-repair coupling factor [candidate division WS6 bacterium GW2011_GWE1_34_7]|uniref:Transcription-repair coupling factor n=1 Tax=candidate division WS6 bacterium GW2011_GWE1_34_7 TaxID=1619093 RepID=A0A0G0EFV5_9BACT|nr:MAG: Transcription-repair coupling factor [candidate division WS6 bacterium GW2011_GWE1_34_7]
MKNFTNEFLKIFNTPQLDRYSTITVGREYQEFVAEILGKKLKKNICLVPKRDVPPNFKIVKKGEKLNTEIFQDLEYTNVERVWDKGEYSILGENILIWPYSCKYVYRVTLFGEEIEEIEILEPGSRKKIESVESIRIFSKEEDLVVGNERNEELLILECVPNIFLDEDVEDIGIRSLPYFSVASLTKSGINILEDYKKRGYEIWYLSNDIFKYESDGILGKYISKVYEVDDDVESALRKGFLYEKGKILVLTDSEILGEIFLNHEKLGKDIDPSSIELLKKILVGDFVVHEDHGIGKFLGVIEREGTQYIEIAYAGNDRLYVPLYSSEKVMKYIGSGKAQPILTGLNSGVWKRVSSKAKEDVENIAKELLQIYALREISKSKKIISTQKDLDEYWEFVNEFEYTDTEDQYIATKKIAQDLEKDVPMDRLLVGDVGFGKTEIAMRATFAVVNSGMQVAILAPTTVLANQHLRVLKQRFRKYPFNISLISRLQTEREKEIVVREVGQGKTDILIGTHAILSQSVKFKNLGLLVVDEEQKFGVKQKEKLKGSRVDTHVLSMTATPIPRTLNLSLMGVRDISVLAIPPLGRRDIKNEFSKFSFEKVKEYILRELKRDGQVYYLHNRVESIYGLEEKLQEIMPDIRVEVAHGRLSGNRLIEVMDKFVNHKIDVLLCTTIIENGLDISNANTLIVDDVNRLGLSQMYQIRGRVGRGEKQAYACFLFDELKGDATLRLEALRESEALGSGFVLSNRDLEIRGAGDILGKKQSGTINSVGYGLYTQLLHEAIESLKDSKDTV